MNTGSLNRFEKQAERELCLTERATQQPQPVQLQGQQTFEDGLEVVAKNIGPVAERLLWKDCVQVLQDRFTLLCMSG